MLRSGGVPATIGDRAPGALGSSDDLWRCRESNADVGYLSLESVLSPVDPIIPVVDLN